MASLKDELAAIRRGAEGDGTKPGRIPPEFLAIMHRVTADQRASGFRDRMPAIGAPAPAFTLANQDGTSVSSAALLARGPLVVSFFRGQW
ncbi:MAG: hypothetical protein ABI369_14350 [Acetobacteraceae bacterium]